MFTERNMPVTVYGVALAMQRNPEAVAAMKEAGWEIASHGLRWLDYKDFSEDEERRHIAECVRIHTEVTGSRPLGIYQGKPSENTLRLVMEEGGFVYSADSYADELPYWVEGPNGPHLIVPYTLDANDMRFATAQGFNSGDQFFTYLKDTFDVLMAEGAAGQPEDAVDRAALPPGRSPGTGGGPWSVSGLCRVASQGLGRPAHRHRQSLASSITIPEKPSNDRPLHIR
jgi:peptidoglycan/xylan/chitin deacetylase (PgdA/CDA1 family)